MTDGAQAPGRHPLRLGKYPVTGVLGEGAMGTVYRAHDPVIQRDVAIKTIRKELMAGDLAAAEIAARFRNEARAVGRLSHPGIVSIYEYGEDEDTAFIAMEYVEGRNLSQILHSTPTLAEPIVLRLLTQLLDALACAHDQGVWHRDIKPANLIVTTSGQLKVTDFGIARIANAGLTQVGSSIGTPGYMAPEQYVGEHIDHRVDLFAAGVLLYRLVTGVLPFRGTPEQVMYRVLSEEPLPPSQVENAIGGERYDAIVAMALAKDPARRFASAATFKLALTQGLAAALAAGGSRPDADATVIVTPRAAAAAAAAAPPVQPGTTAGLEALARLALPTDGVAMPAVAAGSTPPPFTTPGRTAGTELVTGWDPAVIRQVEQALTQFVGPMARVLVRQAAKAHGDFAGLQSALVQHVQGASEQSRFLSLSTPAATGVGSGVGSGVMGRTGTGTRLGGDAASTGGVGPASNHVAPTGGTALANAAASAPTEAMIEAARLVLTRHIGPISKIIMKKALATQPSRAQLALAIAGLAGDGVDRDKLVAELVKAIG